MTMNAGNYSYSQISGPSGSFGSNAAPAGNASVGVSEKKVWDQPGDTYTLPSKKEKYAESIVRDMNSGRLTPETKELVDALLPTDKPNTQKVQVKTFAVNGIQASNIILIERVPPTLNGPNYVLYLPQNDGDSFFNFKNTQEMNDWLKDVITDPNTLETFLSHFPPYLHTQIKDVLIQFKKNEVNAIVGPYAYEGDDVFSRLDNVHSAAPAPVNGLTDLRLEKEGADGRPLYSGKRPTGETVYYEYDAYGNFQGEDRKGNFYFVKNGLNSPEALSPLTSEQFRAKITTTAQDNVGTNDVRGLYQEFLHHLENPAYGMSDALQSLGVSKDTGNTLERYLENPFTALLLDLNKNNIFGKLFGVDKETMDKDLAMIGGVAQGFVPYYGEARMLASLTAKALKNEPLTDEEKVDLADAMALKPGSQARKNLPSRSSKVQSGLKSQPGKESEPAAKPKAEKESEHITELTKDVAPVEEIPLQGGKLMKLGGTMENLSKVDDGLYTFADVNKKGKQVRLNIMAHGEEPGTNLLSTDTTTPVKMYYDGKLHTPSELLTTLKSQGINPSDYDNVRLLMCYSANGREASFAAEFSKLIGRPVKGYEGTLSAYVTPELIQELSGKVEDKVSEALGGKDELLPVEHKAVENISTQYVKGKFATKAFVIAKKNPHYNPIKAWTFTYKPATFSPTP